MNKILFIFIILFILIFKINSQNLNTSEAACLLILLGQLNITSNIPSDLCTLTGITCKNNGTSKTISLINLSQLSTNEIKPSDTTCFNNLEYFQIQGCYIDSSFLYSTLPPKLTSLTFKNCRGSSINNLFTQPVSQQLTSIGFPDILQPSISLQLDFSKIKTLNSFIFRVDSSVLASSSVKLNNDLISLGSTPFPSYFESSTINLPSMQGLTGVSSLNLYTQISTIDYSNISTCSAFSSIQLINNANAIQFPPFSQIPIPNNLTSIFMRSALLAPPNKIDLSNLKSLKSINLRDVQPYFHINNEIPFLPISSINYFEISGSTFNDPKSFIINSPSLSSFYVSYCNIKMNFSTWKYNEIKQLSNLGLSNNQLTGTIDSSFCNIPTLSIGYNQLNGSLPTCISCYLNSQTSYYYQNNNFDNFNPVPICTTILPNLWYNSTSEILYLYGKDIGIRSADVSINSTTLKNYSFLPITPSQLFQVSISKSLMPSILDIAFNAPSVDGTGVQIYTLATSPKLPIITNIIPNVVTKQIVFKGSFFSYNKTSIKITIDGTNCDILSSTFYTITCSLSSSSSFNFSKANVDTILQIDDNSLNVINGQNSPTPLLRDFMIDSMMNGELIICQTLCGASSFCNQTTGNCEPYPECPKNCSNAGTCNVYGVCECNAGSTLDDCSGVQCQNPTCSNNGKCLYETGQCKCNPSYYGPDCNILTHYVTSVSPCSIDGGQVNISGWFPDTTNEYTVMIGSLGCQVTSKTLTEIVCQLGPGVGTKNIIVTLSNYNLSFTGIGLFNYYNPIKQCLNNCTSIENGVCDTSTGICNCTSSFTSYDCSIKKQGDQSFPTTNTEIDTKTASAQMNSKETVYQISIQSLSEISLDGSIVNFYPLQNNWIVSNDKLEQQTNIYKFEQTINNSSIITYTIEEVKNDKQFEFGTTKFMVLEGSIKISVNISNYQYENLLNTLQLSFLSAASSSDPSKRDECNEKESSIDLSNANNQQDVNYISIYKNSRQLIGKFINKVISDGKETFMSSTINKSNSSSVVVSLNLPHCNTCLIDPDFSVLVDGGYRSECGSKNKWFIPVVVVVPCVAFACILTVSVIVYRKNRYNLKILSFKLKKLNK